MFFLNNASFPFWNAFKEEMYIKDHKSLKDCLVDRVLFTGGTKPCKNQNFYDTFVKGQH